MLYLLYPEVRVEIAVNRERRRPLRHSSGLSALEPVIYPLARGTRGSCLISEWKRQNRCPAAVLGDGTIQEPVFSGRMRVELADEMEFVGDQAQDFVLVVVKLGEEAFHRRLEVGEGGKVLVVDCGLL